MEEFIDEINIGCTYMFLLTNGRYDENFQFKKQDDGSVSVSYLFHTSKR